MSCRRVRVRFLGSVWGLLPALGLLDLMRIGVWCGGKRNKYFKTLPMPPPPQETRLHSYYYSRSARRLVSCVELSASLPDNFTQSRIFTSLHSQSFPDPQ